MRGIWIPIALAVIAVIIGMAMFAPTQLNAPPPGVDPTAQSTPAGS